MTITPIRVPRGWDHGGCRGAEPLVGPPCAAGAFQNVAGDVGTHHRAMPAGLAITKYVCWGLRLLFPREEFRNLCQDGAKTTLIRMADLVRISLSEVADQQLDIGSTVWAS